MLYTENDVCRLTGLCPPIIDNWRAHGLINLVDVNCIPDYCLEDIRVIKALTSSGDTLSEILLLLNDSWHYTPSGWQARVNEFRQMLQHDNTRDLKKYLYDLITSYALEDLMAKVFIGLIDPANPLNITAVQRQNIIAMITTLVMCTNPASRYSVKVENNRMNDGRLYLCQRRENKTEAQLYL